MLSTAGTPWPLLTSSMAVAVLAALALAIYPEGHFDKITKCTEANFEGLVKDTVDSGKTLFVRWIASTG